MRGGATGEDLDASSWNLTLVLRNTPVQSNTGYGGRRPQSSRWQRGGVIPVGPIRPSPVATAYPRLASELFLGDAPPFLPSGKGFPP